MEQYLQQLIEDDFKEITVIVAQQVINSRLHRNVVIAVTAIRMKGDVSTALLSLPFAEAVGSQVTG
jgi:ribosome-binding factor A